MRYISLFAGIGGFDLALNRLGHTCVWANEWDKYRQKYTTESFGINTKQQGKPHIQKELAPTLVATMWKEPPKVLIQETSQQSPQMKSLTMTYLSEVSHAKLLAFFGKRRGFDDTRGTLFEIARILKDKQPSSLFLKR